MHPPEPEVRPKCWSEHWLSAETFEHSQWHSQGLQSHEDAISHLIHKTGIVTPFPETNKLVWLAHPQDTIPTILLMPCRDKDKNRQELGH